MTAGKIDLKRKSDAPSTLHSEFLPAKKSLGQNFLIDPNIIRKIVGALPLSDKDLVIEIGPGRGALTGLLAATGARVVAVEKDRSLAEQLTEKFSRVENLSVVAGDFMEYDISKHVSGVKIFGNIPYNITSSIVSRLVDQREKVEAAILMVQDEVASRLSADPGTKEYGAISIRLQLVSKVERLFFVTRACFRPRPRVDSCVVRITFNHKRPLAGEDQFVSFVKAAFGMRRKMFRHFVARRYGKEAIQLLAERFKTGRVETFSPREIYSLFEILERNVQTG